MSTTKPRRRSRGTLGDAARAAKVRTVLDATARALSSAGPGAFNVRDVAKRVGASTMVVYTLFGGRDGLLDELRRDCLERLAIAFDAVPNKGTLRGLGALSLLYRRFALDNREYYHALSASPLAGAAMRESRALQILVEAVRECMARGTLASADPAAVADGLWGLVHGMVGLELGGHFADATVAEHRLVRAGSALLAGLRPR